MKYMNNKLASYLQVRECLEHTSAPMDGAGLTEALHARGINVRYLGRVAAALKPHTHLSYLHAIAVGELVLRAAKHIYTAYLQVRPFIRFF